MLVACARCRLLRGSYACVRVRVRVRVRVHIRVRVRNALCCISRCAVLPVLHFKLLEDQFGWRSAITCQSSVQDDVRRVCGELECWGCVECPAWFLSLVGCAQVYSPLLAY
jgi:hypothetical protein